MLNLSIYFILLSLGNFVLGYHFYNPNSQQIFKSSSKTVPSGYIRLRPPRHVKNGRYPLPKRNSFGFCTDPGFVCNVPYNKTYTAMFECKNDNQCPRYYKCCEQKCFQHKICVESTYKKKETDDGVCEKWPYNCASPYPFIFSQRFLCLRDSQCPKNYKCCSQNCFVHKICSKAISITRQSNPKHTGTDTRNEPIVIPTSTPTTDSDIEMINTERTREVKDVEETSETVTEKSDGDVENIDSAVEEVDEKQAEEVKEDVNENTDEAKTTQSIINEESVNENLEATTVATSEDTEVVTHEQAISETSSQTFENFGVTDKVTVVVVVTPDPNSIESILLQNTPIPQENVENVSSTRNPEYEEYYEHYDENADENEDDYEENKK